MLRFSWRFSGSAFQRPALQRLSISAFRRLRFNLLACISIVRRRSDCVLHFSMLHVGKAVLRCFG
eukprot:2961933-Alexandrium_andersonii.AAC.1